MRVLPCALHALLLALCNGDWRQLLRRAPSRPKSAGVNAFSELSIPIYIKHALSLGPDRTAYCSGGGPSTTLTDPESAECHLTVRHLVCFHAPGWCGRPRFSLVDFLSFRRAVIQCSCGSPHFAALGQFP